jgi:hypothetical protein
MKDFSFLQNFQTNCRALSQGAEQQGCDTDHIPTSHAKVNKEWGLYLCSPYTHSQHAMRLQLSLSSHHYIMLRGNYCFKMDTNLYFSLWQIFQIHAYIFTYSSECHQFNEGDSRRCLYNPTLLFLFRSREFFLAFLIWSVKITYIYLHIILNIPQ